MLMGARLALTLLGNILPGLLLISRPIPLWWRRPASQAHSARRIGAGEKWGAHRMPAQKVAARTTHAATTFRTAQCLTTFKTFDAVPLAALAASCSSATAHQ